MDIMQAMRERHSVRRYKNAPIEPETAERLEAYIEKVNSESGLHFQLIKNEPKAFDGAMAHYGHFSGVTNYIALIGKKGSDLEEKCGYYGEKVVLEAQLLGLNTCWVAMTYKRIPEAFKIEKGEKLTVVISVGYGETQGHERSSKLPADVSDGFDEKPEWFRKGVEAALLAPTATNQQKFRLELVGEKVRAKAGLGFYSKMDLGIVKYHFELGSGKDSSVWA